MAVTSVGLSPGLTGLTVTSSATATGAITITTSGVFTLGGRLAIANGGTNAIDANGALTNLLPPQGTSQGKFLTTNGTITSWATAITGVNGGATGLITSVSTTGNVTLGGNLAVTSGGTGSNSQKGALTNLLPPQATNGGKFLTTNGLGTVTWGTPTFTGVSSFSAGTTGLLPSGNATGAVTLTGNLAVTSGGTGSTTPQGACTNLLPPQAGNIGKVLGTTGSTVGWVSPVAAGVSSFSGGTTGLLPSGNATGAIILAGNLAVTSGGTGSTTPQGACTNLLPPQAGNIGKVLGTTGSTVGWVSVSGGGGGLIAATIAALRATAVSTTSNITVNGYYSAGDGGGGLFYGVTTGGPYVDNGGSIITTGFGVSASSAWIRVDYNAPYNVLQWGAYNNNSNAATTTAAIQRVINFVGAVGGGAVYFPGGDYLVSSTITVTSPNITLIGDNLRASTIVTTSTTIDIVSISGIDTARVEKLNVSRIAVASSTAAKGFSVTDAGNVVMENVSSDNNGTGFYIRNSGAYFLRCRAVNDTMAPATVYGFWSDSTSGQPNPSLYIQECVTIDLSSGTSYGIYVYGSNVKDLFIRGFESATNNYGIWIQSTGSANNFDIDISEAIIDTFYTEGIVLVNLASASVVNTWFNPASGATDSLRVQTCKNVLVNGNQFFGGPNYATHVGVYCNSTSTTTITGNSFQNNNVHVKLSSSPLNTICGNAFYNLSFQGASSQVLLETNTFRTAITGNVFDGTATYYLNISSGCGYNYIVGNTINANSGTPVLNNGGSTNQTATYTPLVSGFVG